jgi:predicted N-acyltransferase
LNAQPLLTDLTTVLDLDGVSGVDDYLARLSPHRRGRVRRELRDFAASDLGLRWTTLGESAAAIAPLLATHHQRYGHADTTAMLTMHLTLQAQALDDLSHVLLCEQDGQLLGALVAYEWDGVWYARIAAAGAGLRGHAFAFFSMVFYAPVLAAIEHGARSYVLGPSGLRTKMKRGASVQTRWSLLAGEGALDADVAQLSTRWPAAATERWLREEGIDAALLDPPRAGKDT